MGNSNSPSPPPVPDTMREATCLQTMQTDVAWNAAENAGTCSMVIDYEGNIVASSPDGTLYVLLRDDGRQLLRVEMRGACGLPPSGNECRVTLLQNSVSRSVRVLAFFPSLIGLWVFELARHPVVSRVYQLECRTIISGSYVFPLFAIDPHTQSMMVARAYTTDCRHYPLASSDHQDYTTSMQFIKLYGVEDVVLFDSRGDVFHLRGDKCDRVYMYRPSTLGYERCLKKTENRGVRWRVAAMHLQGSDNDRVFLVDKEGGRCITFATQQKHPVDDNPVYRLRDNVENSDYAVAVSVDPTNGNLCLLMHDGRFYSYSLGAK
jgi:hypothetical protein